ncbi:hypothetical protein L209DRAFT_469076 [Thermothelomyces heterothallicus CBS 203.75]
MTAPGLLFSPPQSPLESRRRSQPPAQTWPFLIISYDCTNTSPDHIFQLGPTYTEPNTNFLCSSYHDLISPEHKNGDVVDQNAQFTIALVWWFAWFYRREKGGKRELNYQSFMFLLFPLSSILLAVWFYGPSLYLLHGKVLAGESQ